MARRYGKIEKGRGLKRYGDAETVSARLPAAFSSARGSDR